MIKLKRLLLVGLAFSVSLVCGCGVGELPESIPSAQRTVTVWVEPSSATPSEPSSPESSKGLADLPAKAHRDAGGPIPKNAKPINAIHNWMDGDPRSGALIHENGAMGCSLYNDRAKNNVNIVCTVKPWSQDSPFGKDEQMNIPKNTVNANRHLIMASVEPPCFPAFNCASTPGMAAEPTVLSSGDIVYYRGLVCAAGEDTLTCWDSKTTNGAVIYKEGADFFGSGEQPSSSAAGDQRPTEPLRVLPPLANANAGGPVPSKAQPVQAVLNGGVAMLSVPDKGLYCDIHASITGNHSIECLAAEFLTARPFGDDPRYGPKAVILPSKGDVVSANENVDVSASKGAVSGLMPQTLQPGDMVFHHDIVCANSDQALTCWDARTGYGAVMTKHDVGFF